MDAICIINEPNFWASQAYLRGVWPPQRHNLLLYSQVRKNLIRAYRLAYEKIKAAAPHIPAGPVLAVSYLRFRGLPVLDDWIDRKVYIDFTEQVADHSDFFGWNYYWVHFFPPTGKYPQTEMNWYVYPQGFLKPLLYLKKFNKPVYVTENGIADSKDIMRADYIREHLKVVHQAIAQGVDVRGYFYWSLMDNFEWDSSHFKKFGLIEIDRANNFVRKVRPSAKYYAEICKNNYLEIAD